MVHLKQMWDFNMFLYIIHMDMVLNYKILLV
jgi:hypothetical protein